MVSLLPTCCGSTQPASEPTAKVSVPPDCGSPPAAGSAPPPPSPVPQADSTSAAVASEDGDGPAGRSGT